MAVESFTHTPPLIELRKRWVSLALSSVVLLAGFFLILHTWWLPGYAIRWLYLVSASWVFFLLFLWKGLALNYRSEDGRLLPVFGPGNLLTILRGLLTIMLLGFLFSPRPEGWLAWLPGGFYTLAAIFDLFDGYLARSTGITTRLGETLDMSLDGLGVLIASFLAIQYGQVPVWYIIVGAARYLFLAGSWLRRRLGKPVFNLPPSANRRPFAGAQMGLLAVVLWPFFSPPATVITATLFAMPFLVGFMRDWLLVSGAMGSQANSTLAPMIAPNSLQPLAERPSPIRQRILTFWLPFILRVVLAAMLALSLAHELQLYFSLSSELGRPGNSGIPAAFLWIGLIILLQFLAMLLLAVGAAGRLASLAVLFSIGIQQAISVLTIFDFIIILITTALFFLGTGAFSLWTPENHVISKRLGEA